MSAERYMVDDAGTVIDKVTLDNYELASELVSILNNYENTLNELTEDNEQLKQRNERQYNLLVELWGLIENKDWETLTNMVKQMKEDEERLQKEWECYE